MKTVSNPIGIRNTLYMNGNTSDIVNSILYADSKDKSDVSVLAAKLKGNTDLESCQNIWNYIKKNIVYRTDPPGNQFIKSPSKLYFDKVGDCKSFSIFYASLLKALNIQYKYRFSSYSNDSKEFTHVYVIAKNSIICDAVMNTFNQEQNYKFKKDFKMTKISFMAGVGAQNQNNNNIIREAPVPIVDFDEIKDLATLIVLSEKKANIMPSGRQVKIEISNEDVIKLISDSYAKLTVQEIAIGDILSWLKKAAQDVNAWCKENLGASLWISGGILVSGVLTGGFGYSFLLLGSNYINHVFRPLCSSIGPGHNGGIILTGDANAIFLLQSQSLTDEQIIIKKQLLNNLGNVLLASTILTVAIKIQAESTIKKNITPLKLLKSNDSQSFNDSRISGAINYSKFDAKIFDLLAQSTGFLSFKWIAFKFQGGVRRVCEMLHQYHIPSISASTDLGRIIQAPGAKTTSGGNITRDFFSYKLHEIIDVLITVGSYPANKQAAAMRIMEYEFGRYCNPGEPYPTGLVPMPTKAYTDLTTGVVVPEQTLLQKADDMLIKGATAQSIYNVLVKGGMSSNSAIAWLISKGKSVVDIIRQGNGTGIGTGTGPGPGTDTPAGSSNLLTYAGLGVLAIKLFS